MQIGGVREFFSQIASLNEVSNRQANAFLSALAPQKQAVQDSLILSDIGRRLSLNANKTSILAEKQEVTITDPLLQAIDKNMKKAKNTLERMHELTVLAQDEKISDLERVNLQMEIEDLRVNLEAIPMSLLSQAEGGPEIARLPELVPPPGRGNDSSVLGRMRDRIINGQEWNVREAWSYRFVETVYEDVDNGVIVEEVTEAGWHVVEDSTIMKQILSTAPDGHTTFKSVDSGRDVPTVREVLEWVYPVVVMDAESAVEGSQYLEQQIDSAQRFLDSIAEISSLEQSKTVTRSMAEGMLYPAYHALKEIAGVIGIDSLNDPTEPYGFLHGGYGGVVYEREFREDPIDGTADNTDTEAEALEKGIAYHLYQIDGSISEYEAEKLKKHTAAAALLRDNLVIFDKEAELSGVRKPIIPIVITIKGL